jgi:26S proteasome regulatory subunit T3
MAASVEISLFKSADAGKSKEVEKDSFIRLKNVERKLQFLQIQEDYIKDEVKNLKRELLRAQEEVRSIYALVN